MDRSSFGLFVSFALHAGVLVASAVATAPLNAVAELVSANETSFASVMIVNIGDALETDEPSSKIESAAIRDEGAKAMGDIDARSALHRYAVSGPPDNADPHIAHAAGQSSEALAVRFDGPKLAPTVGDPRAPTAPWGRDAALGNDASSARGKMWGDEIGQAFGVGGLGVAGLRECGCGVEADVTIARFSALDRLDRPASESTVVLASVMPERVALRSRVGLAR